MVTGQFYDICTNSSDRIKATPIGAESHGLIAALAAFLKANFIADMGEGFGFKKICDVFSKVSTIILLINFIGETTSKGSNSSLCE